MFTEDQILRQLAIEVRRQKKGITAETVALALIQIVNHLQEVDKVDSSIYPIRPDNNPKAIRTGFITGSTSRIGNEIGRRLDLSRLANAAGEAAAQKVAFNPVEFLVKEIGETGRGSQEVVYRAGRISTAAIRALTGNYPDKVSPETFEAILKNREITNKGDPSPEQVKAWLNKQKRIHRLKTAFGNRVTKLRQKRS